MPILLQFSSGKVDEILLVHDVKWSEDPDAPEHFSVIHPHSMNCLKKGRCGKNVTSSQCVFIIVHTLDKLGLTWLPQV